MSIDLNYPLRKKTLKERSFYSKIFSRLNFFLFFYMSIFGLSIYILMSNALIGTVSEIGPYSFIREAVLVPLKNSSVASPASSPVNTAPSPTQVVNSTDHKDALVANESKRSTLLDSLPTIEGRLFPISELMEKTQPHSISIESGNKSVSSVYFTRSCPNVSGARIAIVVSALGISQTGTQRAINLLPQNVTLAFASNGNSLNRWMQEAKQKGQEVMLQIPMQSFNELNNDDVYTLKITKSSQQLLSRLRYSLRRGKGYFGVMNYRGAMFLSNKDSVETIFKEFAALGLLFFDDGSSSRNLTRVVAPQINLPYAVADLYLDDVVDRDSIREKLKKLSDIARVTGQAIGVASAFDESVEEISKWLQEEHVSDVSIVPLSCLVKPAGAYAK